MISKQNTSFDTCNLKHVCKLDIFDTCYLWIAICYLLPVTEYLLLSIWYLMELAIWLFWYDTGYLKLAITCKKIVSYRSCNFLISNNFPFQKPVITLLFSTLRTPPLNFFWGGDGISNQLLNTLLLVLSLFYPRKCFNIFKINFFIAILFFYDNIWMLEFK